MKGWRRNVVDALMDIADSDAQRAFWLSRVGRPLPSPTELICQLLDDTALSDELAAGPVFSEEGDQILRRLGKLCQAAPLEGNPADVMVTHEWREIVSVAGEALRVINAL